MNLIQIDVHDLSEVDFDDLYERSKDTIDINWPADSSFTDAERKAHIIAIITSGFNNEWPGLNVHAPSDRYVASKTVDLDTGKDMQFVTGFILEDGTFDGRHFFTAADENGSRNYVYSEAFRQIRSEWNARLGVTKTLYRNILANSTIHKSIRLRQNTGIFIILEDVESPTLGPNFRNVLVQFN